jgi:hypothetical protein
VSEWRLLAPRGEHSGVAAFGHRFRADRTYRVTVRAFSRTSDLCGEAEHSARRRLRIRVS